MSRCNRWEKLVVTLIFWHYSLIVVENQSYELFSVAKTVAAEEFLFFFCKMCQQYLQDSPICTVPMGSYFRDRVSIRTFFTFHVFSYISVSLFSVFWLNSSIVNSVCMYTTMRKWQSLIFTCAYTLNFIIHHFGSLFWLPRVPIGSLFLSLERS